MNVSLVLHHKKWIGYVEAEIRKSRARKYLYGGLCLNVKFNLNDIIPF